MFKFKKSISTILVIALLISSVAFTVTANAVTGAAGETVYVEVTDGYGTPNCYMWAGTGSVSNSAWPGKAMTNVTGNIYSYSLDNAYEKVIFNGGGAQTDDLDYPGDNYIYKMASGAWEVYDTSSAKPSVTISKKDGTSFKTDTVDVTVTASLADTSYYTVDGGTQMPFTGSATVTMGANTAVNSTTTIAVFAENANGTVSATATYTKKDSSGGGSTGGEGTMGLNYGTNPNNQVGGTKTITGAADFDESMIIAQGIANDDPRIFRGSHEGPVYDSYALYASFDDTNLYLGVQYVNVTDVVDPAQNYPISDNGKPSNGDIPQVLAFKTGTGIESDGGMDSADTDRIWGMKLTFNNKIDTMACFSSKPNVGEPSFFTTTDAGVFTYEKTNVTGFKAGGVSFKYEDGFFGSTMMGINGNGYAGYVPSDCLDEDANWVDFLTTNHSTAQDTFMTMTIPLSTIGVTKDYLTTKGIQVMHINTFGESGIGSLPQDPSMLDNASEPYSADSSTSAEKDDEDEVSYNFASIGHLVQGGNYPTNPTTPTTPSTSPSTSPSTNPSPTLLGDANKDGFVNVKDTTSIQKYIAGLEESIDLVAADVNKDTFVNVKDATSIQKYLAGLTTSFE